MLLSFLFPKQKNKLYTGNVKHWFIPFEKNNNRAQLLKPFGLVFLFTIYLANQYFLKTIAYLKPGVLGYSSEITVEKVLSQTNSYRIKNNLPILKLNSLLNSSAKAKAENMFSLGYWAHNAPDGSNPWYFFKQAGYSYSFAGENLAKDFYDTESLMQAWINSSTHRSNIISDKYQEIGIAVVNGILNGYQTSIVVQHFGTPLFAAPQQELPKGDVKSSQIANLNPEVNTNPAKVPTINPQTIPINPLEISKTMGGGIFILLVGLMFIDAYVTLKNNTHRFSGSSIAHMGFLIVMLLALLMVKQGSLI